MSISKEQLEQNKRPVFTDEQKERMTSVIFEDEFVSSQLQQAQDDYKNGVSTYCGSEEEFEKLLIETGNEK